MRYSNRLVTNHSDFLRNSFIEVPCKQVLCQYKILQLLEKSFCNVFSHQHGQLVTLFSILPTDFNSTFLLLVYKLFQYHFYTHCTHIFVTASYISVYLPMHLIIDHFLSKSYKLLQYQFLFVVIVHLSSVNILFHQKVNLPVFKLTFSSYNYPHSLVLTFL